MMGKKHEDKVLCVRGRLIKVRNIKVLINYYKLIVGGSSIVNM